MSVNKAGLFGFPVTPFGDRGQLDFDAFARQVELLIRYGAEAVFPACGTGEMPSLSMSEHHELLKECIGVVGGRVPVYAAAGFGLSSAQEMARQAASAGAQGVLAFPPYLGPGDSQGVYAYFRELAAAATIDVIIYQRDNLVIEADVLRELSRIPNIVGLKDGSGQIDRLQQLTACVAENFQFFNGTPTAEIFVPSVTPTGVSSYSSALLNCIPEFAQAFNLAYRAGDEVLVRRMIREVVIPIIQIRDRRAGYAVSLIKAGARLRGLDVGPVRAPLPEPTATDLADLQQLLERLDLAAPLEIPSDSIPNRSWSLAAA